MYADENSYWRDWARDAARQGSALYAQLVLALDGDAGLKGLTERRRAGQPPVNLLLAAVHYLLLRGADHPLRNFYATVGGAWSGEDLLPLFRDFAARHETAVRGLIESRVTNTNEVARACVLRAGFAALAMCEALPLHLIEIGPSAGLNMIWDHYGMRFSHDGQTVTHVLPDSPLQLDCELRGSHVPPLASVPKIAARIGLERDPVDLTNDEDRDWLRALLWPDQPWRLERLDRAIALFRARPQEIRRGDALALLPDAMAQTPPDRALCVYHSFVTYQFDAATRDALVAILTVAGLRRPVWNLAYEFDGGDGYTLNLSRFSGGAFESRALARAQAHGGWMDWLLA